METNEYYNETCPYCNEVVKLPKKLGTYRCPECGQYILNCSMCEHPYDCHECKYKQ